MQKSLKWGLRIFPQITPRIIPIFAHAKVTGFVGYKLASEELDPHMEITRVKCTPAGLNRYGPALIGELHVIGLLVPVWLTDHRESTHLDIKPEMPFTIKISNRNFPWEFFYPDVRGAGYEVSVGETYFFLVLALSRLPGRRFIGLIVIRKARVYQRVGLLFSRCISSQCWMKLGKRVPLVLE